MKGGDEKMWIEDEKGYPVDNGYMGYINGEYKLFETEDAYKEFLQEEDQGDE